MAAREMEVAQKARRKPDYDSEDDDDDEERSEINLLTGSISSSPHLQQRSTPQQQPLAISSFDPYSPTTNNNNNTSPPHSPRRGETSLLDDGSVHTVGSETVDTHHRPTMSTNASVPGAAGYLEMEEEPPRTIYSDNSEAITTSSGLLLTHRRPSPSAKRPPQQQRQQQQACTTIFDKSDPLTRNNNAGFRNVQKDYFEVEHGFLAWKAATEEEDFHGNPRRHHSMPMLQARRFLSYVRIWMVVSAAFLLLATGVLFHSFGHKEDMAAESVVHKDSSSSSSSSQQALSSNVNQIILVPMEGISERQRFAGQQQQQQQQQFYYQFPPGQIGYNTHHYQPETHQQHTQNNHHHGVRRALLELRQEFEDWVVHHGKKYHSPQEKEHRFQVWSDNHHRTMEKNQRHGPCKLTNQAVFGSNHFKDLTQEEFKARYLTGYNPPKQEDARRLNPQTRQLKSDTLKPKLHGENVHPSIQQRIQQKNHRMLKRQTKSNEYTMRNASCDWFDVSCWLRWLWNQAGIQFGSIIGTMEPKYDADHFPNAVDWRDYGIVTEIRSQGSCGACWAITAVETVESAHAMATGKLYDLSEAEIIACDDSCEMCSGGWPQNAFDYVMDNGGLPLYNSFPYDADTLYAMTLGLEGSSSSWTEDSLKTYRENTCPSSGGGKSHDSDEDGSYWKNGGENEHYGDYSNQGRYGNIKGYGYATDRCICYSDGSGCGCDKQDEELAVANIASYGPAVVCVDAALWQDYSGGIMTSDIGCGSEFLDVNHCVQVVGYAFTDVSDGDDGEEDRNSHSRDSSSSKREGYWIVRNQWGGYWGMNGYAYVAMGANTCGILNDMTQAYL